MATLFIASSDDKRKAASITQAIEDGKLPSPPALQGIANTCENPHCGDKTILRYYVPGIGHCCWNCFEDWRTTPVYCSTRADDVHIGRVHIIPQCIIDAELQQDILQACQDARSAELVAHAIENLGNQQDTRHMLEKANAICRKISESPKHYDAMKAAERRWLDACKAAEARRGDVVPGRYEKPVITPRAA